MSPDGILYLQIERRIFIHSILLRKAARKCVLYLWCGRAWNAQQWQSHGLRAASDLMSPSGSLDYFVSIDGSRRRGAAVKNFPHSSSLRSF